MTVHIIVVCRTASMNDGFKYLPPPVCGPKAIALLKFEKLFLIISVLE